MKKDQILDNLEQYKKEYKETESTSPYYYEYYSIENGSIVPDDTLNSEYGESRENFEKFKKDNDFNIGYSGLISLREIIQAKKLIGYVKETKKPQTERNKVTDEVIRKAKKDFYDYFGTDENNEAFNYYVTSSHCGDGLFGNSKLYHINTYIDIIEDYNYDEEYREFIDKLLRP